MCVLHSVTIFITIGLGVIVESNVAPKSIGNSTDAGWSSDHVFVDDVDIENLPFYERGC